MTITPISILDLFEDPDAQVQPNVLTAHTLALFSLKLGRRYFWNVSRKCDFLDTFDKTSNACISASFEDTNTL